MCAKIYQILFGGDCMEKKYKTSSGFRGIKIILVLLFILMTAIMCFGIFFEVNKANCRKNYQVNALFGYYNTTLSSDSYVLGEKGKKGAVLLMKVNDSYKQNDYITFSREGDINGAQVFLLLSTAENGDMSCLRYISEDTYETITITDGLNQSPSKVVGYGHNWLVTFALSNYAIWFMLIVPAILDVMLLVALIIVFWASKKNQKTTESDIQKKDTKVSNTGKEQKIKNSAKTSKKTKQSLDTSKAERNVKKGKNEAVANTTAKKGKQSNKEKQVLSATKKSKESKIKKDNKKSDAQVSKSDELNSKVLLEKMRRDAIKRSE